MALNQQPVNQQGNPDADQDYQLICDTIEQKMIPTFEMLGQVIQELQEKTDKMESFIQNLDQAGKGWKRNNLSESIKGKYAKDLAPLDGFYKDAYDGDSFTEKLIDTLMDNEGNISDQDSFIQSQLGQARQKHGKFLSMYEQPEEGESGGGEPEEGEFAEGTDKFPAPEKEKKDPKESVSEGPFTAKRTGPGQVKIGQMKKGNPAPGYEGGVDGPKDIETPEKKESLAASAPAPKPAFSKGPDEIGKAKVGKDAFAMGTDSRPDKAKGGADNKPTKNESIDASGEDTGNNMGLPTLPKGRSVEKTIRELGLPMKNRK